jgi:hypothetical protein
MKHAYTLCGQHAEVLNVTAGGTYDCGLSVQNNLLRNLKSRFEVLTVMLINLLLSPTFSSKDGNGFKHVLHCVSFQGFTMVDGRLVVFWVSASCGRCVRLFGVTYCLHLQGDSFVHVDAQVIGKKLMCRLCGKVRVSLVNHSSDWLFQFSRITDVFFPQVLQHRR